MIEIDKNSREALLKLQDMLQKIEGTLITSPQQETCDVLLGFTSDLMSDVLTLTEDNVLLITGLATIQTIRTAEMADIGYIIFVRNKQVSEKMISLANESNITLISTHHSSFTTSVLLGELGIKGIY